jgi:ABC-type Na+ efflux pump permease subunit
MKASGLSPEKKKVLKQFSRRRVSTFFFAAAIVSTIFALGHETDMFFHALDDYALFALSIVAIVLIVLMRNSDSFEDLRRLNRNLSVLTIVLVAFIIFGVTQEYNDPEDFANEPGQLMLLITLIINRFT